MARRPQDPVRRREGVVRSRERRHCLLGPSERTVMGGPAHANRHWPQRRHRNRGAASRIAAASSLRSKHLKMRPTSNPSSPPRHKPLVRANGTTRRWAHSQNRISAPLPVIRAAVAESRRRRSLQLEPPSTIGRNQRTSRPQSRHRLLHTSTGPRRVPLLERRQRTRARSG